MRATEEDAPASQGQMKGQELEEASYSFSERFLITICQYQMYLYLALVLEAMLLFLAVLSLLFADLDAASETILLLDFILLGAAMGLTLTGLVLCNRRSQ